MRDLRPMFTDFTRGEVAPEIEGRVDVPDYYKSCRKLENMIVQATGGAERTPGSVYLADALDQGNPCKLIPFEYSLTEYFYIEIGLTGTDAYYKVWKVSDHSVNKASAQFGDDTWSAAQVRKIKYAQKGNVMYFAQAGHVPHKIVFTSPNTWVVSEPAWACTGDRSIWSGVADYPAAVSFHEQRLVFARGLDIWGSQIQNYEEFGDNDPLDDASGYHYELSSDKNEDIYWLVSHLDSIFGTSAGDWRMHGYGGPITPLTLIDAKKQSTYGSIDVQAVLANDAVVFAQKGGKVLRDFIYSYERGGYLSPNLTFMAKHILGTGLVDMAFQQIPDPIIWCVRADGEIATLTYQKQHNIVAWQRQPIDGLAEAVGCVATGAEDEVWIQTKRTINSVTKRYIEYFKPHAHFTESTQEDCFFVRCGKTIYGGPGEAIEGATQAKPVVITITGHGFSNDDLVKITDVVGMTELNNNVYMVKNKAANTFELYLTDGTTELDGTAFTEYDSGGLATKVYKTVTGLTHLQAKDVDVLVDGAAHPQCTVAGGSITLNRYGSKIQVGIPCISKLQPQRLGQAPDRMKRIDELTIRFYQTLGCKVGPDEDNLGIIPFREGTDPMDSPPPLFTGDKEVPFLGDYEKAGNILIIQDQPLPMTVLAIMPSVGVSG